MANGLIPTPVFARLVALEVVVESLLTDSLSETDDPAKAAEAMTQRLFRADADARQQPADDPVVLQITEIGAALIDRAAKRAQDRRSGQTDQRR